MRNGVKEGDRGAIQLTMATVNLLVRHDLLAVVKSQANWRERLLTPRVVRSY